MKQKFFLSFLAIAVGVLSASAQAEEKLVVNAGNMENITIANGMDVVLLQGSNNESISLEPRAAESLNMKLSGNAMSISSQREKSRKEKTTVYLYVNNLKTLTVEGNSTVNSSGALDTRKLEIYVDGEARVHLITNGAINAYSLTDSEIEVKYISDNRMAKR